MSGENNQASLSCSVRLLLLNGLLNGTRWCLGALCRQMIDVSLALQAEIQGAKELKATLATQICFLQPLVPAYTEAKLGSLLLLP